MRKQKDTSLRRELKKWEKIYYIFSERIYCMEYFAPQYEDWTYHILIEHSLQKPERIHYSTLNEYLDKDIRTYKQALWILRDSLKEYADMIDKKWIPELLSNNQE